MIEVKNLVKRYGDNTAVRGVSFTVEKGRIYGFLGPNGAGKSTTMNIITGCLAATEGEVTIGGYDIYEDPVEAKACIGYLPEQPPLYMDMTPYEYLEFVGRAKGLRGDKLYKAVDSAVAKTGLTAYADRLIKNLSKGYKQRVGIAQALIGNPPVIIFDEPTVGLDPKQIIEIRDLIRTLGKTKTVILSSHILAEISAVCDHIMILSGGRLVANDTPMALEQAMNASSKLIFRVKCDLEEATRILETVDSIEEYTVEYLPTVGCTEFTLPYDGNTELQEGIFFAFADAKRPLLHIATERMTLEDIFLRLTTPQFDEALSKEESDPTENDEQEDNEL